MIEVLIGELASAGGTEIVLAAGEQLFKLKYPKTAEVFYGMDRRYMTEVEEKMSRAENGHF